MFLSCVNIYKEVLVKAAELLGQRAGSVKKALTPWAYRPEFEPQNPQKKSRTADHTSNLSTEEVKTGRSYGFVAKTPKLNETPYLKK